MAFCSLSSSFKTGIASAAAGPISPRVSRRLGADAPVGISDCFEDRAHRRLRRGAHAFHEHERPLPARAVGIFQRIDEDLHLLVFDPHG